MHVLPRTAQGFGEILPTPKALRVRRYPTTDRLPPPADGRFHSSIGPVTAAIRQRMGESWSPACPVGLADLAYVTVSFRGFDGKAHTGELVLARSRAADVVSVFRALFAADYPIEEMRLPTTADLEAPPTGDGNDTAALVCRATRGTTAWSAHAYGLAIDVNPFLNPYHKGDLVLPERASAYLDRTRTQPGIIHPGDLIVREFARIGWSWGGAWTSLQDYQHFTATGR
ncbi:M15 family metallopeptidase [Nocardioides ginsengisoli]